MDEQLQELITKVQQWLEQPYDGDLENSQAKAVSLLKYLQVAMKSTPGAQASVGPWIGRVKGMQRALDSLELMSWVPLASGHLAIGHRPSGKLAKDLKLQSASHVLTLLSEKEGAKAIDSLVRQNDLAWMWFPMVSAAPPEQSRYHELAQLLREIEGLLNSGAKIYVHCAAGIHRTGMISYTLLRFMGRNEQEARQLLQQLRSETGEGVGVARLAWADQMWQELRALSATNQQ